MLKKIKIKKKYDKRGYFFKFFNTAVNNSINQCFITKSKKNVIRGFHYYGKKNKSKRLIYLMKGKIIDYLLDLRKKNFGKVYRKTIIGGGNYMYLIPDYCAHAYFTKKESQIIYFFEKKHEKKYDFGVNPKIIFKNKKKIIVSKRDLNFPSLNNIKNL